jgi:hypothetical protein
MDEKLNNENVCYQKYDPPRSSEASQGQQDPLLAEVMGQEIFSKRCDIDDGFANSQCNSALTSQLA